MTHVCKQRYSERKRQTGIGLVEILVAVLLLSMGFLATAQMQIQSMRNSRSSYSQLQAYLLANEIVNRMRINIDGVVAGSYDDAKTTAAAINSDCSTNMCSASELAQQDIYEWSSSLYDLNDESTFVAILPSSENIAANGLITALDNGLYGVTMTWSDEINGIDQAQSLTLRFVAEVPN